MENKKIKRVYFVRHGLSISNEVNKYQEWDEPLSEMGRKQAGALAKRFETIPIDITLSSTMERALETARVVSGCINKEIVTTDLLHEIHRPNEVRNQVQTDPAVLAIMKKVEQAFIDGSSWHHSDEENFHDLKERAKKALAFIEARSENHILVATHGLFLRMVIARMLFGEELTPREFVQFNFTFKTTNTGITLCDYNPERKNGWTGEPKPWGVLTWNDHSHLG